MANLASSSRLNQLTWEKTVLAENENRRGQSTTQTTFLGMLGGEENKKAKKFLDSSYFLLTAFRV